MCLALCTALRCGTVGHQSEPTITGILTFERMIDEIGYREITPTTSVKDNAPLFLNPELRYAASRCRVANLGSRIR